MVASHQLTPPMAIVSVTALVLFRRCRSSALPLLMLVLMMTWISYLAVVYMHSNIAWFASSFYQLLDNLHSGVGAYAASSPGRSTVAWMARGLTAGMWLLALAGGWRRIRSGHWDLSLALLAVAPLVFVTQAYGNEMLFRVFLFSLPFAAFLAAGLVYPDPSAGSKVLAPVITAALSMLLLVGLLFADDGDEQMNYVTHYEVEGVQQLYQTAEPGALILALNDNAPLLLEGYERYTHVWLVYRLDLKSQNYRLPEVSTIAQLMRDPKYRHAYLVITRSQIQFAGLLWGLSTDKLEQFQRSLAQSPDLTLIPKPRRAGLYARRCGGRRLESDPLCGAGLSSCWFRPWA